MEVDFARLDPRFHHEYKSLLNGEYRTPRLPVMFLAEFRARNTYAMDVIMKKTPSVLFYLGYVSMSCEGGWAMPVWQHICNDIKAHKDDATFRRIATQVAHLAPEKERSFILFQFGFRGNWLDLVREALALGIEEKYFPTEEFYSLFSPEVIELLKAHKHRKEQQHECVVCMDAEAVSQLPCGHVCMCKACEKLNTNKTCPLCRTMY